MTTSLKYPIKYDLYYQVKIAQRTFKLPNIFWLNILGTWDVLGYVCITFFEAPLVFWMGRFFDQAA